MDETLVSARVSNQSSKKARNCLQFFSTISEQPNMQNSKKDQLLHKSSCGALLRKGEQEDQVYHLIIIIIIKKDIFIKKI